MRFSKSSIFLIFLSFSLSLLGCVLSQSFLPIIVFPSTFFGLYFLNNIMSHSSLRGGSIFHPVGATVLVTGWGMVLSPIFAIIFDHYIVYSPLEISWIEYAVIMSYVYLLCLALMHKGYFFAVDRKAASLFSFSHYRAVQKQKVFLFGGLLIAFSLALNLYVFIKFGGVSGYLSSWSDDRTAFQGLGWVFMLSEPLPMLLLLGFLSVTNQSWVRNNLPLILILIFIFVALKFFTGGLRGSRSNTIWGVFWAVGIFHIYYYKFRAYQIILGLGALVSFAIFYTMYKSFGVDAFSGGLSVADTQRFQANPIVGLFINDFSRVGVHSVIVHEYYSRDFDIKYGQTYLNSLFKLFPFFDVESFFDSKSLAGAELFYNIRYNRAFEEVYNSRLYGLYGEGLFNFGPIFPILLFFPFGFFLYKIDKSCRRFSHKDFRGFLTPFFANCLFMVLMADSDNIIFFLFKNGFLVFLFVYLCSKKNYAV